MTVRRDYPNVSIDTAQALLDTLQAISNREGSTTPSDDVQRKALQMLNRPHTENIIIRRIAPARVYDVKGETGDYKVLAYIEGQGDNRQVIDAECTCPARGVCWHMLIGLTSAARDGLSLAS